MGDPTPPALVAATDEERLGRPDFEARLERLLEAGCPAVWLRAGRLPTRAFHALAVQARARCDARGAALWVGDRADVARAVGADHVQLPEDGLTMSGARRAAGPRVTVGRSVHSLATARRGAAEGADLLVLGTMFRTASHPGRPPAGPALLATVRSELGRGLPILAIGGITPERVAELRSAGADGVVAIRALWDAADPTSAVNAFRAALGRSPVEPLH